MRGRVVSTVRLTYRGRRAWSCGVDGEADLQRKECVVVWCPQ